MAKKPRSSYQGMWSFLSSLPSQLVEVLVLKLEDRKHRGLMTSCWMQRMGWSKRAFLVSERQVHARGSLSDFSWDSLAGPASHVPHTPCPASTQLHTARPHASLAKANRIAMTGLGKPESSRGGGHIDTPTSPTLCFSPRQTKMEQSCSVITFRPFRRLM